MKEQYDFSRGTRGPVVSQSGKTRITIYLDSDVVDSFRSKADSVGMGYQTLINQALREYLEHSRRPVDEETLRRVIREELHPA